MKKALWRNKYRLRAAGVPLALFLAFCLVVLFYKKDEIRRDCAEFIQQNVMKPLGLRARIAGFGGNLFGAVSFHGVELRSEKDPQKPLVFKAQEITLHYRIWDLFTENIGGAVRVVLEKPVFYADVPILPDGGRRSQSLEFVSKVLGKMQARTRLVIQNGQILWTNSESSVSGIEGSIENRRFDVRVRLDHIKLGETDFSTDLLIEGKLEESAGEDVLVGDLKTLGTVINWMPFEHESQISFMLSPERLHLNSPSSIAGIQLSGTMGLAKKEDLDLTLKASNYNLSSLMGIVRLPAGKRLIGTADAAIQLNGPLMQPVIKGQLLLKDGQIGSRTFKNMQLVFAGVYPELQLSESRIVLTDGTTMKFANQRLTVGELFDSRTYQALVTRQDQDDVTWGDWRLERKDKEDSMIVERGLGDAMRVKYERYGHDEAQINPNEPKDEVEVEYLLSGSDSFMMQLNEDEEKFVGMQKKVSF